jgi:hypothetical protein
VAAAETKGRHEQFLGMRPVISANAGSRPMARLDQGSTGIAGGLARRGRTILAPLPEGIEGPFGPELRRVLKYHQGQSTMPRLLALLRSVGVAISKWQLVRLLNENQQRFIAEPSFACSVALDVLRAGLETSLWVTVDDTGARHAGKNGFCTQIGNEWFTWFRTRFSKSRLNFLDLLRAGHTDYVLNDAAYDYMRNQCLPAATIPSLACSLALLKAEPETRFSDQTAWKAHLDRLTFNALKPPIGSGSPPRGRCGAAFRRTNSFATPPC